MTMTMAMTLIMITTTTMTMTTTTTMTMTTPMTTTCQCVGGAKERAEIVAIMLGHQLVKLGAEGCILSVLGEGATPRRTPAHSLSQAKRPARPHPDLYGR